MNNISSKFNTSTIAWIAVLGAGAYAAFTLFGSGKVTEGIPGSLKITHYKNLTTGEEATTPESISASRDDIIRVYITFDYFGPDLSGTFHAAMWRKTLKPHDEFASAVKSFTVLDATTVKTVEDYVDIELSSSSISSDSYGLYVKIMSIPGDDIFSPYYAGIIDFEKVEEAEGEVQTVLVGDVTSEPLDIDDICEVNVSFQYKGPAGSIEVYSAIGNDGFFGFDEIIHSVIAKNVEESTEFVTYNATVNIPITSAISPGSYDVYAKAKGVVGPTVRDVVLIEGGTSGEVTIRDVSMSGWPASIDQSATIPVTVSFEYRGSGASVEVYAAIGNDGIFGFDEINNVSNIIDLSASDDWVTKDVLVNIPTSSVSGGKIYSLYAKVNNVLSPVYKNTIEVISQPSSAEFKNVVITSYEAEVGTDVMTPVGISFDYRGPAESHEIWVAIGNDGMFGFDEVVHGTADYATTLSREWSHFETTVQVPTQGLAPGVYDLYGKIGGAMSTKLQNVIEVTQEIPEEEIQNVQVVSATSPVETGQVCNIGVTFQHRGPAVVKNVYAAIGNAGTFGFDEILQDYNNLSLTADEDWKTYNITVPILITQAISPGAYNAYAKVGGAISPSTGDIIEVNSALADAEYRNVSIRTFYSPVNVGDYIRVWVQYQHRGKADNNTLYAAIGNDGTFGFDEVANGSVTISTPAHTTWTDMEQTVDINVHSGVSGGVYDLYAKIGGLLTPYYQNLVTVVAPSTSHEFKDMEILWMYSPVTRPGYCRMRISLYYKGPGTTGKLHAAIGNDGIWGFDEVVNAERDVTFPAYDTWLKCEYNIDVYTNMSMAQGFYDAYCKLMSVPGSDIFTPTYQNNVEVW